MSKFKKIIDIKHTKNWAEAIGFYAFYVIAGFLVVMAASLFIAVVLVMVGLGDFVTFESGTAIGALAAWVYGTLFSVLLVRTKKFNLTKSVLYVAGTFVLSAFGIFVAMILPAFITTREKETGEVMNVVETEETEQVEEQKS